MKPRIWERELFSTEDREMIWPYAVKLFCFICIYTMRFEEGIAPLKLSKLK